MAEVVLAKKRTRVGTGASHADRAAGWVPVVLYGEGVDGSLALTVEQGRLEKLLSTNAEGSIVTVKVEGEAEFPAMIKEVQYHPVRGTVRHVDFQGISLSKELKTVVPILLSGTPVGVREGGVMQHQLREVEVECLPQDLPEHIEADISHLGIGDVLFVRDLVIPAGVKILSDGEEVIVTILAVRAASAEEEEGEQEDVAAPAEGAGEE
ncbi:MAG: 50S ribosomal protein L25 [Firmicutes bacterium]|jgi:large subunit ribosomal protein L25|nr:50S ribosomal protein L25 [Bacillota bacterium]